MNCLLDELKPYQRPKAEARHPVNGASQLGKYSMAQQAQATQRGAVASSAWLN